jgi:LysM repeat protein
MSALVKKFHVSMNDILAANHLTNPDHLAAGQTLRIPPASPVMLAVTPIEGTPGQSFDFTLTGAIPAETITFTITSPAGHFQGGPHTAGNDGTVKATYNTSAGAHPGTYTVTATGDHGTHTTQTFRVAPSTTPTS